MLDLTMAGHEIRLRMVGNGAWKPVLGGEWVGHSLAL